MLRDRDYDYEGVVKGVPVMQEVEVRPIRDGIEIHAVKGTDDSMRRFLQVMWLGIVMLVM